jgi:hypothetical protein
MSLKSKRFKLMGFVCICQAEILILFGVNLLIACDKFAANSKFAILR